MSIAKGYSIHGSGLPIVLVHSSMSSKKQWQALTAELESDYRVIAIDLLGYGDTAYPRNESTFALTDEASWVESVIEKEVAPSKSVHLIGHSYGAATALRLTYKRPDKVRALTVFEPVAFHLLPKEEPAYREIAQLVVRLKKTLTDCGEWPATEIFFDYWSGEGAFSRLSERVQSSLTTRIKKAILDFQALFNEPLTLEDYATLSLPCSLIVGRQSPISSQRIAALLQETLPNLEFNQVSGGHMSPVTHAPEVNPIIISSVKNLLSR